MTTNYLDEADQLCDRLAIIDAGHIRVVGSPKELKAGLGGDSLSLTIGDPEIIEPLASNLKTLPFIRAIHSTASGLNIQVESPEKALPAVLETTNRMGCRLDGVEYHRPRLDDVFLNYTGHTIQEGSADSSHP